MSDVRTEVMPWDGDPCGCVMCADRTATLWIKGEPWCDECDMRHTIIALEAENARVTATFDTQDAAWCERVRLLEEAIATLTAERDAARADNDRIENRLNERRKMHRTDVLLARTADVRARVAGLRPADAMAISNLEEAYTDYVTRLSDAEAKCAALTPPPATEADGVS